MKSSKYDPLSRYLSECGLNEVTLKLEQIEAIIGDRLPPSARRHQFWANLSSPARQNVRAYVWIDQGFKAFFSSPFEQVRFVKSY